MLWAQQGAATSPAAKAIEKIFVFNSILSDEIDEAQTDARCCAVPVEYLRGPGNGFVCDQLLGDVKKAPFEQRHDFEHPGLQFLANREGKCVVH